MTPVTALSIVSLLVIYVFLSLFKAALRSLSSVALRRLAEAAGEPQRRCLEDYLRSPSDFVLRLQTVIQASMVASAVLLSLSMWPVPGRWPLLWPLASVITLVVVLEQIFPRLVQSLDRERLLTRLLPAWLIVGPLVRPLTLPFELIYRLVPRAKSDSPIEVSDEDVRAFIDVGEQAGILDKSDGELIESVVELGDTVVREVMTPRVDMIGIEASSTVAEVRDLICETRHSRVPVYRERVDNVEGVVSIKDLISAWRAGKDQESVVEWMKPARFVPETKDVSSMLREFQRDRLTFAVVVDEYGGISGLVTMEDLLEEIVGEIAEEHEEAEEQIVPQEDGSFVISAKMGVETLDEVFGLDLEDGLYDTIGGLVFSTLGRIPAVGEQFSVDGLRFEVLDADHRRVNKVRVVAVSLAEDLAQS